MKKLIPLLLLLLSASRCDPECQPTDMYCDGDKIMICNAGQEWEVLANCADYEPGNLVCIETVADSDANCEVEK